MYAVRSHRRRGICFPNTRSLQLAGMPFLSAASRRVIVYTWAPAVSHPRLFAMRRMQFLEQQHPRPLLCLFKHDGELQVSSAYARRRYDMHVTYPENDKSTHSTETRPSSSRCLSYVPCESPGFSRCWGVYGYSSSGSRARYGL